jgi:crotonobetainyl-CoA:carnitine CoA-transferase CaiB-like acyl-CoA transferase
MEQKRKHINLTRSVVESFKEKFLNGEIHPGEKLPSERELAEQMNVSRTTIREAIIAIKVMGLIEMKQENVLRSRRLAAFENGDNYEKREEIVAIISEIFKDRSSAEIMERLERAGIWHAPVNDYEALTRDPQVLHNQCFSSIPGSDGTDITILNHPIRYDGEAPKVRLPPQPLGAADILLDIGYTREDIVELEKRGVLKCYHG